jgi:hypothetical protein
VASNDGMGDGKLVFGYMKRLRQLKSTSLVWTRILLVIAGSGSESAKTALHSPLSFSESSTYEYLAVNIEQPRDVQVDVACGLDPEFCAVAGIGQVVCSIWSQKFPH